jgi:SAM-dependent methyltransferase
VAAHLPSDAIDADAFNAFEAEAWELKAPSYADFFGAITTRLIDPLLDAAAVGPASRVLDVATGPGYAAARAAERGATVIGADVAEAMVQLARGRNPGLEFQRADAQDLPFADGAFDAVVANFLVLHLGRPERAAAEFARVLAPGGRVALTAWDLPNRSRIPGLLVEAVAAAGAAPPPTVPAGPDIFRFSRGEEFMGLLHGAGLQDVAVQTVMFTHPVSSAERLWEGLLSGAVRMSALVGDQPEATKTRIRAEFEKLADHHRTNNGLAIPVSVKLASGRKPIS